MKSLPERSGTEVCVRHSLKQFGVPDSTKTLSIRKASFSDGIPYTVGKR